MAGGDSFEVVGCCFVVMRGVEWNAEEVEARS